MLLSRECSLATLARIIHPCESDADLTLVGVMQQWAVLQPDVSERTFFGAVFALAIGSNFGAYSFV